MFFGKQKIFVFILYLTYFLRGEGGFKDCMNIFYQTKHDFNQRLKKIPKKNRIKFQADLLKLIELAQKDNYENFNLER